MISAYFLRFSVSIIPPLILLVIIICVHGEHIWSSPEGMSSSEMTRTAVGLLSYCIKAFLYLLFGTPEDADEIRHVGSANSDP